MTAGVTTEARHPITVSRRVAGQGTRAEFESGTWSLALVASVTLLAARSPSSTHPWLLIVQTALAVGGPLLIVAVRRRWPASRAAWDRWMGAVVAAWCLWPMLADSILRGWELGEARELVLLVGMQNAVLALSVYSHRQRCQQVACLLGSFLVLFAIVIEASAVVGAFAVLYGIGLLWWLMARYWERIQQARSADQVTRCLPVRWSVLGMTLITATVIAALFGAGGGTTYMLRGFMPTSGGDRWYDPLARAGVGDGDAMVAGKEDAMSFGPIESELFLESCMPTLYDMFNDMYGEPIRPASKRELVVTLTDQNVQQKDQHMAQTQRSGREFSVLRRRSEAARQALEDRRAPAMLYVVGPVPVHLALESFNHFDGVAWTHVPGRQTQPPIRRLSESARPWFSFEPAGLRSIARHPVRHAAKVINLRTNRVPAPPHMTAVHVDRLDRDDFWGWTDDAMAAMVARSSIPQLTVLHLRSQQVDLQPLREYDFSAARRGPTRHSGSDAAAEAPADQQLSVYLQTPDVPDSEAARRARQWTNGVPPGWQQVEAVVARLRQDFRLETDHSSDPDTENVVEQFLAQGGGPAYGFASSAAIILRHAGYPTRLVGGFYARRDRFDRVAGQTTVLKEDAHVWVQVCIDDHTWVTIEPTPGYQPPRESLTWTRWAWMIARGGWDWAAAHPVTVGLASMLLAALWIMRLWLLDSAAWLVWQLAGIGRYDRQMRATVRLLEWRGRRCGRVRPDGVTISQWYGELAERLPAETAVTLTRFLRQAERVLYAPASVASVGNHPQMVRETCQHVARGLTVRAMRQASVQVGRDDRLAAEA